MALILLIPVHSSPSPSAYATDIYFWKRFRVNYPFIFNFEQEQNCAFGKCFFLTSGLVVLALADFLANINLIIDVTTVMGNPSSFAKFISLEDSKFHMKIEKFQKSQVH